MSYNLNPHRIEYRPEIDGLRAIAVISVIFFHSQLEFFSGGFLGVTIFFVISGYLITNILQKELIKTGTISLLIFYKRRIRRLIPLLLFIILISIPFSLYYLLPISLIDFSKSIISSLFYVSNIYFWFSGEVYGAESNYLKPFLHTWSLSIEEQFYIFFPIIILLLFKFLRQFIFISLVGVFILSLCFFFYTNYNHPVFSFYFIFSRAWEILAGCLIAIHNTKKNLKNFNNNYNKFFPIFGLLLIIFSILFYNEEFLGGTFFSILVVLGTSLILLFFSNTSIFINFLCHKYIVYVGLISYSLYLWHYPVLTYFKIAEIKFNFFIYFFITFLFSMISFKYIETPFRYNKIKNNFVYLFLIYILISCFCFYSIQSEGIKKRYHTIFYDQLFDYDIWNKLKDKNGDFCHNNFNGCYFDKGSSKNIIIIGDSYAASIMNDLYLTTKLDNFNFKTFTMEGCFFYPGFDLMNLTTNVVTKCNRNYFKNINRFIDKNKNSVVILLGSITTHINWNNSKSKKKLFVNQLNNNSLEKTFKQNVLKIANKGNKIILIYPIPIPNFNFPQKLFNNLNNLKNNSRIQDDKFIYYSLKDFKNNTSSNYKIYDSIKHENIIKIFPEKIFCDFEKCYTHNYNRIFFIQNHPSEYGAKKINKHIVDEIKNLN